MSSGRSISSVASVHLAYKASLYSEAGKTPSRNRQMNRWLIQSGSSDSSSPLRENAPGSNPGEPFVHISKTLSIVAALLLATGMVSAAEIGVSPNSYEAELVAGDTYRQNITLENRNSFHAEINLSTNVTAVETNTEGVSVSYSENLFVLQPGQERTEQVVIETGYDLEPDEFNFTTYVRGERFRDGDGDGDEEPGDFGREVYDGSEVEERDNQSLTQPPVEDNESENNQTSNETEEGDETDSTSEQPDQDKGLFGKAADAVKNPLDNPIPVTFFFILIALLSIGGYFAWEKYNQESKEEQAMEELPDAEQE